MNILYLPFAMVTTNGTQLDMRYQTTTSRRRLHNHALSRHHQPRALTLSELTPDKNIIPRPSLNPSRKCTSFALQRNRSRYSDQTLAIANDVFMISGSNIRLSDSELRKTVTRFGMTLPRITNANNAMTRFSQERERVDHTCFSGKYVRLVLFTSNAIIIFFADSLRTKYGRQVLTYRIEERLNSQSSIVL